MTHPASAGLRELANLLDALAATGCVVAVRKVWLQPTKAEFGAAMHHFGVKPTIRATGGAVDRFARAGGEVEILGLRVDVENWLGDVGEYVEEQQMVKTWKLPEVLP